MAEHLTHMSEAVMTVVRALGDFLVLGEVARPRLHGLSHFGNRRVKIARLAGIEVSPIVKEVPDYRADEARFGLFEVHVSKFVSWVSHKYTCEVDPPRFVD
jgi:hypothetical protein